MRRGRAVLVGIVSSVSACNALLDIDTPTHAVGGAGSGGSGGSGGVSASGAGKSGSGGKGGSSGKGAGGAAGNGTGGGDAGEGGDGMTAGGVGGQTGGVGGDAGRGGAGRAGAGASAGGASGNAGAGGTSGGGTGGASGASAGGVSGTGGKSSSGCGDGTGEAPEACDDGNSLACGTCSADCLTATPLAPARGTMHVAQGSVQDGERFTLDDGFGGVDFEFDNNNVFDASIQTIFFNAMTAPNTYRDLIIAAVNEDGNGLAITAEVGANPGEVLLTNDNDGIGGNRPITDQVNGSGFTHTGMSGGAGGDCPLGTGCISDAVCASRSCVNGFCAPP